MLGKDDDDPRSWAVDADAAAYPCWWLQTTTEIKDIFVVDSWISLGPECNWNYPGFHLAHATYLIPLLRSYMYCSSFDQFLTKCWSWTGIHLLPRRSKPTQECARFNIFQKRQIIPIAHFYGKAHTILVVGMITIQPNIFLNRRPISFFEKC